MAKVKKCSWNQDRLRNRHFYSQITRFHFLCRKCKKHYDRPSLVAGNDTVSTRCQQLCYFALVCKSSPLPLVTSIYDLSISCRTSVRLPTVTTTALNTYVAGARLLRNMGTAVIGNGELSILSHSGAFPRISTWRDFNLRASSLDSLNLYTKRCGSYIRIRY